MSKENNNVREALKNLPSVDELIKSHQYDIPLILFKKKINLVLDQVRKKILNGDDIGNIQKYIDDKIILSLNKYKQNSLRQVINGTGIILHTGLGRAPISKEILYKSIDNTYPYTNLEFNLDNGKRGDRNSHISELLSCLCKVESSLIVNNNAAAVMLMLNSLCENKEVIISRGQQVEIGGSFRIPDVILKSQCHMVEVGTTNKTHLYDYENAINDKTAAILYVHTSNYKVVGFTNTIEIEKLGDLSKKYNIPLLVDLGSGSLADYKSFGLPMEKMVSKYIDMGADLLAFSGDKLLGGPQAGILVGHSELVSKIFKNPLYRAFRCDKTRISIMENILKTYYTSKNIYDNNLSIKLFKNGRKSLLQNAKKVLSEIPESLIKKIKINIVETYVEAGSGSLPNKNIPSIAIVFENHHNPSKLYDIFLNCKTPVVSYVSNQSLYIDFKAIPKEQIPVLIKSIKEALK